MVTILSIFFATTTLVANGDGAKTSDNNRSESSENNQEIIDKKPVQEKISVPNPDNDQWHNPNKRFRISEDFEGMLPLITYKEQQTA